MEVLKGDTVIIYISYGDAKGGYSDNIYHMEVLKGHTEIIYIIWRC